MVETDKDFSQTGKKELDDNITKRLAMRGPFKADMMPLGAPIWFVADKEGHLVCQIMPSTDGRTAGEIADILNIYFEQQCNK